MADAEPTFWKITEEHGQLLAECLKAANRSADIKLARKQLDAALENFSRSLEVPSLSEQRERLETISDWSYQVYSRINQADTETAAVITRLAREHSLEDREQVGRILWDLSFETGIAANRLTRRIAKTPKIAPALRDLLLDVATIFETICQVNFKHSKQSPFIREPGRRWIPANSANAGVRYAEIVIRDVLRQSPTPAQMRTILRSTREEMDRRRAKLARRKRSPGASGTR